jgi:HEAT repeat protein
VIGQNVADEIGRRRDAALAGHRGDEQAARQALTDPAPRVRATALGAVARMGRLQLSDVSAGLADHAAVVRRRACDVSVSLPTADAVVPGLVAALADAEVAVAEAACFALGELGGLDPGAVSPAVAALAVVATEHRDQLAREAAVAALGAIGHEAGLPAILAATSDKPAVRRRAVLALAPFAGADVEHALARARSDRDWQVRQAADDLSGPLP